MSHRLQQLQQEVEKALDELRALAHGVYPPLLADRGPGRRAALGRGAQPAAGASRPVAVGRFATKVESAVYFCVLEALQNVQKHARGARRVS